MNIHVFRIRLEDWLIDNLEKGYSISIQERMRLREIVTDAWFAGHKQGLRDFLEGWEQYQKDKGETA